MVSVVGTLLALLVFFALFGVFLTQYVPLWMIDNESQFTSQTQQAFAGLKSNMDLQAALNGPNVYATPFVMSSQGVPLIAQPTQSLLNFVPRLPGVFANVSMTVGPGGGHAFYQNFSLGTLQMQLPNRYYSPQTFEFEDDAVIQSQADTQQVLSFPPTLAFNQSGGQIGVTISLVQMYGNATQTVSVGTQEVYSHFLNTQTFTSTGRAGAAFNGQFRLGTHFPCAWANYLNGAMLRSGIGGAHYSLSPSTCAASNGQAQLITLQFLGISSMTVILGQFTIVVGVGLG
ncbi:MAG: hypothetical protein ACREDK_06490 [Thermoplasmata archaeon]